MNWHYKNNDQVVGPLSDEAITELHACGVLAGETLVRRDGTDEWLPLDVAFHKVVAPQELLIKFYCSKCGTKIGAEPADAGNSANCPSCGISLVVPLEAADGIEPSNSLKQLPAITANTSEAQCATDDSTAHQSETDELTSDSAVDLSRTASGEGSPMHKFGTTLASFAKSAAHEVKINSQIAVLRTRIENAKQIELRKAHYALGRKFYEARILLSMQDEIEELERQIAEKGERAVIEENETKGAMLKRVGKNAAKTAESELLSLKLKQALTHLGELMRNSSQQTIHPGTEIEMEAILLVEFKIQQFEEDVSSLRALSGKTSLKSKKPWVLVTCAVAIIFLAWTFVARMEQEKKHSVSQIVSDTPEEQDQSLAKQSKDMKNVQFTNTLGMKFIPIPISSGPSKGQRVMFSIWETRRKDYAAYAAAESGVDESWKKNPEYGAGDNGPVFYISQDDAEGFCNWLTIVERNSGKIPTNTEYRLPTDHEWSCAVGIGDAEDWSQTPEVKNMRIKDIYPWGTEWPPKNMVSESILPVGEFSANPLGIYDMGGNVGEICVNDQISSDSLFTIRGQRYMQITSENYYSSNRSIYNKNKIEEFRHQDLDLRSWDVGFRCVMAESKK